MKKWEYVNECMVVGLDNISLTITVENIQDGWEMPIAEISAKIPDLSKVTITFYGWLSMQDIKNKIFVNFIKRISKLYVDSYEIYDEDTDEVFTISRDKFLQLLADNGLTNIDIIE